MFELLGAIAIVYCIILHIQISSIRQQMYNAEASNHTTLIKTATKKSATEDTRDFTDTDIGLPGRESVVINWLKTDWPMKLGALMLLIGIGWATTYAFMNNLIGPMGRITLGIVVGLLIMIAGNYYVKKHATRAITFVGIGNATILMTIFAAREVYNFFSPASALVMMFLTVLYAATLSYKNKFQSLAIMSLIFGGIAPLLTGGEGSVIGLFSYIMVLTIGTLWIIRGTAWKVLTPIATGIVMLYSAPYFLDIIGTISKQDELNLTLFTIAFGSIFYLANIIGISASKKTETTDITSAAMNGLYLLGWITMFVPQGWQEVVASAIAIICMYGAVVIGKKPNLKEAIYIYAGMACVMIAAALAFALNGTALLIAYILEIAIITIVGTYISRDARTTGALSLLQALPLVASIGLLDRYISTSVIFNKDFAVFALLIAATAATGIYLAKKPKANIAIIRANALTGSIYALAMIPIILSKEFTSSSTMTLIIYTLIAIVTYIYGTDNNRNSFALFGKWLLGVTIGYLLLIEVWNFTMSQRIITFIGIGILLLSTTFIRRKKK